jgi:transitional endoplasmic reticulum ATPase
MTTDIEPASEERQLLTRRKVRKMGKQEARRVRVTRMEGAKEVIVPEGMPTDLLIQRLEKELEGESEKIQINRSIECYPLDGAVALMQVTQKYCGWATTETQKSKFGDNPPQMITVPIGHRETLQVPWGQVFIPGVDGVLVMRAHESKPKFMITANVPRRDADDIHFLLDKTEECIRTRSIYTGQAIKVDFSHLTDPDGYDIVDSAPRFLDVDFLATQMPIFDKAKQDALAIKMWGWIENPELIRGQGESAKRGALFYGEPGCGKTLLCNEAAVKGVAAGYTVILCPRADWFVHALRFGITYEPCMIDEMLNTLDGVEFKNRDIVAIMTSNNISKITQAMKRPGRVDCLMHIGPPGPDATLQLLRKRCGKLLAHVNDEELEPIASMMAGQIPAVIDEVIKTAKMAARIRTGSKKFDALTIEDLEKAHHAMLDHASQLVVEEPDERSDLQKGLDNIADALRDRASINARDLSTKIDGVLKTDPSLTAAQP